MPSDLEALYKVRVKQIDPFYLAESSWIFQMVREALEYGVRSEKMSQRGRQSLSTLELSFAISSNDHPNLPLTILKQDFGVLEIRSRCRRVEDRLKVCCAGLLEVHHHRRPFLDVARGEVKGEIRGEEGSIQYLHRTVRDYLEQPEVWSDVVLASSPPGFAPSMPLLCASVMTLKTACRNINFWEVTLTAFEAGRVAEILNRYE